MHSNQYSGNSSASRSIPHPQRERWQPLRSGFVNLYRYDQEEFHYENGRLLLRGNNGTGKSRVLALQLPFLLDGETIPQRLEPDADPAKRVEWNLLMGRYPDRTGYTWIEFGRREDNGDEHFVTLGCGLSAVEGQNGVRKWFFVTSQRIGKDLELVTEAGQVVGKDRLRERIGISGQVYETVGLYRCAVNDALFHLDDYRYASFVNLLIQLRRPQLTRRLDEGELSGALSEALPPVSAAVISELAEAFRSLESDRDALETFKAARAGVERFLSGYRGYAEVAAKRRADRVRRAHHEYEVGMTDILDAETDCDLSLAALARLKAEIQGLSAEQHALQAEITALQQSPQIKDADAVERAHRDATEKRREAVSAAVELTDAVQARKARIEEHIRAKDALELHRARLTTAIELATQTAMASGLEVTHREFGGLLDLVQSADEFGLKQARERIEASVRTQMGKAEHVRTLNERMVSARNDLQQVSTRREQLSGLLDDARERLKTAQQEHTSTITSFLDAAADWRASLTELRLPFEEAFVNTVTEWCENPQVSNPFQGAFRKAAEEVSRNFAEQRLQLQQLRKTREDELNRLKEERNRLAGGMQVAPPRPHTRGESVRTGRPGAPLWSLCDFVDDLDRASRAGIESALEAAGLLDAWLTPSGELLDPENHDIVLVAASGPLPPEGAHLGTILKPSSEGSDEQCEVPPYVVADTLRYIGAKPNVASTWVSPDGRWQNGPLLGCWSKPAAEYIGPATRELARCRRILELGAAVAEAQTQIDALVISISELDRRDGMARSEAEAAPVDERVRGAYDQAVAVAREVDGLRSRLAEAEECLAQKRLQMVEASGIRDQAAIDLGIANLADNLESLESGIVHHRVALSAFWPTLEFVLDAGTATEKAWMRAEEATARESRQKEIAERLDRTAIAAEVEYETVRQAAGADVDQIAQRLEEARRRLDNSQGQETEKRRQYHNTELTLTRVDERLRNLSDMLTGQNDRRDDAASSLRAFAGTRLLHLAVAGIADDDALAWSTARTAEVARELASRLDAVESDDTTWELHQQSVPMQFNELMQALSAQGCQPSATFRDDVFIATALFAGREFSMEELHQTLSDEVTSRQMLLDAREREILENHLVGEVSSHLNGLLNAAEEQVQQMNVELESRPMSTGMKLRFVWRPVEDGPLGLSEVRRHLMHSSCNWSAAERRMLGSFLQQQIQSVRAQMEGGTWQESLAEALDYRKWHRFGVERCQDGVWKRLTRRTHGTGSGGEKAVALTLPHFAAAAAFYRTADPLAPRLIMLDEAFVGIDADMRAKCMGLIHTFDLDFVMTSEREWGCYQTLPGLAIYQLSTRPGIDAIGLTRWVWNGQQRILEQNLSGTEDAASLVAASDR